jgi:heme/copper-type cytochrome/quinol oxidase subunit 3
MSATVDRTRRTFDVSALPTIVYGPRATIWWGVVGLIAIEGTALAIVGAAYLYLRQNFVAWPPAGTPLPSLGAATVELLVLLGSIVPMAAVDRFAQAERHRAVVIGLAIMVLLGLASLGLRALQFAGALGCRWDSHAYGSVVWTLLGMHAAHVLTSTFENALLLAVLIIGPLERKDFVDAHVNAVYWYFIAAIWVPTYALVYLAPRWL